MKSAGVGCGMHNSHAYRFTCLKHGAKTKEGHKLVCSLWIDRHEERLLHWFLHRPRPSVRYYLSFTLSDGAGR